MAPGNLPKVIPEPYNGAFTSGGKKFNVDPALVAAIFTEENLTGTHTVELPLVWKDFVAGTYGGRHRPVGNPNAGWPQSGAGATGPFQFLPSTWAQYGVDNSGDNRADINNLLDASAGAAHLLAAGGATADKPPADWHNAIYAYNHADWYVNAVMTYYHYYTTGNTSDVTPTPSSTTNSCGNTTSPSGCQNPFSKIQSGHNLRPERVDMGVDYGINSAAGANTVDAICSGTILNLVNSGWNFGGYDAFISIKIDSGPAQGLISYMAEDCVPVQGLVPGKTHVNAGDPICHITQSSTGIETGWAAPPGNGETMAALAGQYTHDGVVTDFGANYNDLLKSLGTPSGTGDLSHPVGTLPNGWPTWK